MPDLLKDLKNETHKHDFTNDPESKHAKFILDLLDKKLVSGEQELRNRAPPLDVVIYALKSIIYPKFLYRLVPDFLRLFSMVEFYRIRVNKKVEDALVWNTYYKKYPAPGVPPLKEDDETYFQHIVDSNESMRKIFMQVVTTCCIMDLQRLWLKGPNTDFWLRWNEYLSIVRRPEGRKEHHTSHYLLSEDEILSLHDAFIEVSNFMAQTGKWIEDNQEKGQTISNIFETEAFYAQFPVSEFTGHLEEFVDYHINFVQEVVQRLVSNSAEESSTESN